MCAHNEAAYIGRSLTSVFNAIRECGMEPEVLVVCDRCTDDTANIARGFEVTIIEKKESNWANSYAENLQIAIYRVTGELTAIVDADIELEKDYFKKLVPLFEDPDVISASGRIVTEPSSAFNMAYSLWEKTYDLFNFGREPRGGARLMRTGPVKQVGFRDVIAPDTDLDIRLSGKRLFVYAAVARHMRKITLRKAITGQINSGRARRQLGIPIWRVFLHSIIRIRPFVLVGYIIGKKK